MPEDEHSGRIAELAVRFSRHDPVAYFFRRRAKLSIAAIVGGMALVGFFLQRLLPFLLGDIFKIQTFFSAVIESLLVLPFVVVVYLELPGWMAGLFVSLEQNAVIPAAKAPQSVAYQTWLAQTAKAISSRAALILGLSGVVAYALYRFLGLFGVINVPGTFLSLTKMPVPWHFPYLLLLLLFYSLPLYAAIVSLYRLVAAMIAGGELFRKFELSINLLHPDEAGGMGGFGTALIIGVLATTSLGAAALLNSVVVHLPDTTIDFSRPDLNVLGSIYAILTPLLFYCWLWLPHRAMQRNRERILRPLGDEFRELLLQRDTLAPVELKVIKDQSDRLSEIKKQYDLVMDTFPLWPLKVKALGGLLTTASLPSISSIAIVLFPTLPKFVVNILALFH